MATTTTISQNRTSPVVAMRVAAFSRIHNSRSWSVEAVKTVFENRVFMMPISKKIFEMTGMDVMATPMVNTSAKDTSFPMVPMYASRKTRMNGYAPAIGRTVAPTNRNVMSRLFFRSTSIFVL